MRGTAGGVLVVVLTAGAVLLGGGPGASARRRAGRLGPTATASRRHDRPPWSRGRRRAGPDPAALLGAVVTGVAAEVRAGRSPADAWRLVLGVPVGADGVPAAADVLAAIAPGRPGRRRGGPETAVVRRRVSGVLAAGRLAAELGAPTAGVLEECARALAADADAETAVRAALAGPRQTTALLTWLPALGVALGALLGADPLGTLLGGGAGTAAGVGGAVLTLLGRRWTGRMVADARAAGTGSGAGVDAGVRGVADGRGA